MKVKELIKLLKSVDKDREVVFTSGMPVEGIHGDLEDGAAMADTANPVVLSIYTLEQQLEEAQIEAEMWHGQAEKWKAQAEEYKSTLSGVVRF